jgi:hypothetical protein
MERKESTEVFGLRGLPITGPWVVFTIVVTLVAQMVGRGPTSARMAMSSCILMRTTSHGMIQR